MRRKIASVFGTVLIGLLAGCGGATSEIAPTNAASDEKPVMDPQKAMEEQMQKMKDSGVDTSNLPAQGGQQQ